MKFHVVPRKGDKNFGDIGTVYLEVDHWNDYSFVTMFEVYIRQEHYLLNIGNVKIGFAGQDTSKSTYEVIGESFDELPEYFFSLGTDLNYYRAMADFPKDYRDAFLSGLNDIVFDLSKLSIAKEEEVFKKSFLRTLSITTIKGQFARILMGRTPLTDFKFSYRRAQEESFAGVELSFQVEAASKPSTNIHAFIGRNGIGKTTILNGMVEAIIHRESAKGKFLDDEGLWGPDVIAPDYFSSLVFVSFSAFDPFEPPRDQADPSKGTRYFYIGLKSAPDEEGPLKSPIDLHKEFAESLKFCLSQTSHRRRWEQVIRTLESDENFSEMGFLNLVQYSGTELEHQALELIGKLSSGHAIVLLTVTKLVAKVEEKTLVIIDEPESHLHPPLLSAFLRSLSELLHDRNGVAIIATHSPVVLQEVPKDCVWKINRSEFSMTCIRPEEETFGENVGTLTREVFGLEVVKSGFHNLLNQSVESGASYDNIISEYNGQLGFEAKAILRALIAVRDRKQQ